MGACCGLPKVRGREGERGTREKEKERETLVEHNTRTHVQRTIIGAIERDGRVVNGSAYKMRDH